jgi:hypothetical protein
MTDSSWFNIDSLNFISIVNIGVNRDCIPLVIIPDHKISLIWKNISWHNMVIWSSLKFKIELKIVIVKQIKHPHSGASFSVNLITFCQYEIDNKQSVCWDSSFELSSQVWSDESTQMAHCFSNNFLIVRWGSLNELQFGNQLECVEHKSLIFVIVQLVVNSIVNLVYHFDLLSFDNFFSFEENNAISFTVV